MMMIDYFVDQLAEAFSRIDFDLQALRKRENDWLPDGDEGMFLFKGNVHPFIVKKHCIDLVREVWHINDGARELIDEKWKAGQIKGTKVKLKPGEGPGRLLVKRHLDSDKSIQLCGDLANVTKHYRLSHATKTGGAPSVIGDPVQMMNTHGKMEFGLNPDGSRSMKFENPVPVRSTFILIDGKGNQLGDVVDIAIKARDSWLAFLKTFGCTFAPASDLPQLCTLIVKP